LDDLEQSGVSATGSSCIHARRLTLVAWRPGDRRITCHHHHHQQQQQQQQLS